MVNLILNYGQDHVTERGTPPREEDCIDKGSYRTTLMDAANKTGNTGMVNAYPEGYNIPRRQHLNAWLYSVIPALEAGRAFKVRIPGATVFAHAAGWKLIPDD